WTVVSGTSPWTFAASTLWDDGRIYDINSRGLDFAGNLSGWTTKSFTYDTTLPVALLQKPAAAFVTTLPTLSGTAADPASQFANRSRLDKVQVAIQEDPDNDGNWWNTSAFGIAHQAPVPPSAWLDASGTINGEIGPVTWWLADASTPSWSNNTKYRVTSRALDRSGNISTGTALEQIFVYDTARPEVAITTPSLSNYNSLAEIRGTAADTNSLGSVEKVEMRVRNYTVGAWWDNSAQSFLIADADKETAWFAPRNDSGNWSLWIQTFTWASGNYCEINARARDNAGLFTLNNATRAFRFDAEIPNSRATSPAGGSYVRQLVTISGTAADIPTVAGGTGYGGTGLAAGTIQTAIRDNYREMWWSGAAFNAGSPQPFTDGGAVTPEPVTWKYESSALQNEILSGASYYVTSRSRDNALNQETFFNVRGSTFIVDTTPPLSAMTTPYATHHKILPTLSGTALDPIPAAARPLVAGLRNVELTIYDETNNQFWTTTGWNPPGVGQATWTATGTSVWTSTNIPAWGDGIAYRIRSWSSDNALPLPGNVQSPVAEHYFIFDSSAPRAFFDSSIVNGAFYKTLASITGTARDYPIANNRAGIQKIEVLIRDVSDDKYWYSGIWNDAPAPPLGTWPTATLGGDPQGITTWNFASVPSWTSGKEYQISARAWDNVTNNYQNPALTYTVNADTHPPVSFVQRPEEDRGYSTADPLTTISGTSRDWRPDGSFKYSGVANTGVKISVRLDESPYDPVNTSAADKWWHFGLDQWVLVGDYNEDLTFGTATIVTSDYPADPTVEWRITAPDWVSGKRYRIRMRATDNISNAETLVSTRTCTVDIVPPASKSVRPAEGGQYNASSNALTTLSGTALDDLPDNVDLTKIRIFYEQTGNGYFWDGGGWLVNTPNTWLTTTNLTLGGTWWAYDFGNPNQWVSGKTYYINTSATDKAGNVQVAWSTTTFNVDTEPPATRINLPVHDASYKSLLQITGTAADDFSGVNGVQTAAQDLSTGKWWNGTNFTGDNLLWFAFNGGTLNNWRYGDPPTIAWQSGRQYLVVSRSSDAAGNFSSAYTVGVNSNTFSFDNVAPAAFVALPSNNSTRNNLPTISGTATDDFSGVTDVKLQITYLDAGDTYYWTGVIFSSETPNAEITGIVASPRQTYSVWTATESLPSWTGPKYYQVRVRVGDYAANLGSRTTAQFLFDRDDPSTTLIEPAAGTDYSSARPLSLVSGTAVDTPVDILSGINKVLVRISTGPVAAPTWFWSGTLGAWVNYSTWTVAASTPQAGSSAKWAVASPAWQNAFKYNVNVRAEDFAGNLSAWTTRTFLYDDAPPTLTMMKPLKDFEPATLSTLSGTAFDPGAAGLKSYLNKVQIAIQTTLDEKFWNGTSFVDTGGAAVWLDCQPSIGPLTESVDWYFTGSTPTWSHGTQYKVYSRAIDNTDNASSVAEKVFRYDNIAPTTKLIVPPGDVAATRQKTLSTISGTASDTAPGELEKVEIRTKHGGSGQYWNVIGQAFNIGEAENAWFVASSTVAAPYTIWFTTQTTLNLSDGTEYSVNARALDKAGNYHVAYTTAIFVYDVSAPQSWVASPVNNSFIRNIASVTGTSYDAAGGTVTLMRVAARQNTTMKWWGGSTFSEDNTFFVNASGVYPWSYSAITADKLTSGASYYIVSESRDNALNIETSPPGAGPSTFNWDVTSPTSAVTYPSHLGNYKALAVISGDHSDISPFAGARTAGVSSVKVSIQDLTNPATFWLVGSGWVEGSEQWNNAAIFTSSWSLTAGLPTWITGRQYKIRSRAYDTAQPAGNDQYDSYPQSGYTITFDTTPPVAAIQTPNYGYYGAVNQLTIISGTSDDPVPASGPNKSDIDYVRIQISSGSNYWTGSSWIATSSWTPTNYSGGNWEYPGGLGGQGLPAWQNGADYTLKAEAYDKAGNVSTLQSHNFKYDEQLPSAAITLPSSAYHRQGSLSTLSGTATDPGANPSGLLKTEIALLRVGTTKYWSWGAQTFTLDTASYSATNLGTPASWQHNWNLPNWDNFDGITFRVFARPQDNAYNYAAPVTSATFAYDITESTVVVTVPAPAITYYSAMPTLSGTARDDTSGVQTTRVKVRSGTTGAVHWAGTGWGSLTWLLVNGTTNWTYPVGGEQIPTWVSGRIYEITPWTLDYSGNTSTGATKTFMFDNTRPDSRITPVPANDVYYSELPTLTGTARDPVPGGETYAAGVNRTELSFYSHYQNRYYNVFSSEFDLTDETYQTLSGQATSWYLTGYSTKLIDGSSYTAKSKSWDNSSPEMEETSYTDAVNRVRFVYDVSKPTSVVTYPVDGNNYRAATLTTISGTQTDLAPEAGRLMSGVGAVKISIQDLTHPSTYWRTGTGWVGTEDWGAPTNASVYASSWAFTNLPTWITGRQYKIRSRAYDT
ncbi:MAG: Ig-like domain repeat protein, partial [Endomicrobiia bacterium]|nr:Ig-like domain repeat protein [Endomicrobiia bacterium]